MSRSGYSDDYGDDDPLALGRWRAQVASSIRGKRGQAFLRELIEALDAMPDKRLIAHELRKDGEVCALGCVGEKRGVDLESLDPEDHYKLAQVFNIARPLVQEIEYLNDECYWRDNTPEKRWATMRAWAVQQLNPSPSASAHLPPPQHRTKG